MFIKSPGVLSSLGGRGSGQSDTNHRVYDPSVSRSVMKVVDPSRSDHLELISYLREQIKNAEAQLLHAETLHRRELDTLKKQRQASREKYLCRLREEEKKVQRLQKDALKNADSHRRRKMSLDRAKRMLEENQILLSKYLKEIQELKNKNSRKSGADQAQSRVIKTEGSLPEINLSLQSSDKTDKTDRYEESFQSIPWKEEDFHTLCVLSDEEPSLLSLSGLDTQYIENTDLAKAYQRASGKPCTHRSSDREDQSGDAQPSKHERGSRRNFDKRTLRLRNRASFVNGIRDWQMEMKQQPPDPLVLGVERCQVLVRKRPSSQKELAAGEFDCLTVNRESQWVCCHECRFAPNLHDMYVSHHAFRMHQVYDERTKTWEIYDQVREYVEHAADLGFATIFMFGPTGSGKTYTMMGLLHSLATDIFKGRSRILFSYFEIAGKKVYDITEEQKIEIKVLDNHQGQTTLKGERKLLIRTADDLVNAVKGAMRRRKIASHARNSESSRAHGICQLEVLPEERQSSSRVPVMFGNESRSSRSSGSSSQVGRLILCDCAGTERRQDTTEHGPERIKETAEINLTLHVLKECIRAMRMNDKGHSERVPFRSSMLTRILGDSFSSANSKMLAIGTLGPVATDVEHTLSTLRTLQMLMPGNSQDLYSTYNQEIEKAD